MKETDNPPQKQTGENAPPQKQKEKKPREKPIKNFPEKPLPQDSYWAGQSASRERRDLLRTRNGRYIAPAECPSEQSLVQPQKITRRHVPQPKVYLPIIVKF